MEPRIGDKVSWLYIEEKQGGTALDAKLYYGIIDDIIPTKNNLCRIKMADGNITYVQVDQLVIDKNYRVRNNIKGIIKNGESVKKRIRKSKDIL